MKTANKYKKFEFMNFILIGKGNWENLYKCIGNVKV